MGFFGTLKDVLDIATLGQVTFFEKQLDVGGKIVNVVVDLNNKIVKVGEEIFRAAPGEVFFPGLGPLAGVFKNEIEDELIMVSPLGLVPSITIFVNQALAIGSLVGVIQHRTMREDEREIVDYVFRGSLPPSGDIILTNMAGFGGRQFVIPTFSGGATVNLGKFYIHDDHILNMPVLIHEMTHVWQIQQSLLPEVFICNGALVQLLNELGESVYDYEPGEQWSDYGLEQQGHIVEDWAAPNAPPMKLASKVFRYVNANVRLSDNDRPTSGSQSLKTLLAEGKARKNALREIHPPRPSVWW